MNPSIWIYGGVHDDPGSRQRFLEELAQQETVPHFIAVEWEQSLFERLAAWRSSVAEGLRRHWNFLTPEDCYELSLTLAWEGDSYTERFPDADVLWLENGFQEADLKWRRPADADKFPEGCAFALLQRLHCPPTLQEFMANIAPPEPRSKKDISDRVWKVAWAEAHTEPEGLERDARWANAISERSAGLHDGWIAIVVGWAHANSAAGNQRLCGLLLSKGFSINSVCLGPEP